MRYLKFLCMFLWLIPAQAMANKMIIPMNIDEQDEHLKAYGIAYLAIEAGMTVDWLLNYKGGSFGMDYNEAIIRTARLRGVKIRTMSNSGYQQILNEVRSPSFNGDVILLEKAPRIAVYTPPNKVPWDDAVTMALEYAEIPYDKIYDDEVLDDILLKYDWLHLHHEDFTGQYGKFWGAYQTADWYIQDVRQQEAMAKKHGYAKVSHLKLAVAHKIRDFVVGGGYLFAMCSATDTYDIALSAEGVDICEIPFDGDPMDPNAQSKIDYSKTFAFKDFELVRNPYEYEFSSIDNTNWRKVPKNLDYFNLFTFSAKSDPVPTMLTQNHTTTVKGFMGQTTSFRLEQIKSNVIVMGDNKAAGEAKYIHGNVGKGTFTFFGGHDPEDYQHRVGDPHTDLSLHPTSPGYRLILNNVLFPAAEKKPQKT